MDSTRRRESRTVWIRERTELRACSTKEVSLPIFADMSPAVREKPRNPTVPRAPRSSTSGADRDTDSAPSISTRRAWIRTASSKARVASGLAFSSTDRMYTALPGPA